MIFELGSILIFILLADAALANCRQRNFSPQLDMTIPSGCTVGQYIKSQIADSTNIIKPTPETAADVDRRLKIISDWRNAIVKKDAPSESIK